MEYIFGKTGEAIVPEEWQWQAVYKDGTFLKQFDDSGAFHQVGEIQQENLVSAKLVNGGKKIIIPFCKGMKLIHRYRNYVFDAGTENERKARVYVWGWKLGSVHSYMFILPDDTIVHAPDDSINLQNE